MLHQALAGLLKDIHRVVSKLPVLFCLCTLGCCPGERRMFSRPLLSRLSIRMSLHIAAFFWPWWVSHFLQPRRMMLLFSMDGVGQVMIDVWIPPDICLAFRPKISICLITPENFVFHGQRVLQLPFLTNSRWIVRIFCWGVKSVWTLYHTGGVLQKWLSF